MLLTLLTYVASRQVVMCVPKLQKPTLVSCVVCTIPWTKKGKFDDIKPSTQHVRAKSLYCRMG